jgi:hypothetical protein
MGTLLATYAVAGMVVSLYAAWLVIGAARLSRRLKYLEAINGRTADDLLRRETAMGKVA